MRVHYLEAAAALVLVMGASTALTTAARQSQTRGLGQIQTKTETGELYRERHALVIGMSAYRAGWPVLRGVPEDTAAVAAALRRHGFSSVDVQMDLTRDQCDRAIRDFIATYGRELQNLLLIYFAGHGYTQKMADGRDVGYVVPIDAPLPDKDPVGFKTLAISMEQVQVYSRAIESKHALMVFDSCFSGSLFETRGVSAPEAITARVAEPVRFFITAGSANQQVPDQSVFRAEFVDGLDGAADLNHDGYVTGIELGLFLQDKVANYTHGLETPQFGKLLDPMLDKGDVVFTVSEASAAGGTGSVPPSGGARERGAPPQTVTAPPTAPAQKAAAPREPGGVAESQRTVSGDRAFDTFVKGEAAYKRGDYAQALGYLKESAARGHRSAMTLLGVMYENGRGVAPDLSQAVSWYRKAAAAGDPDAQAALKRLGREP